MRPPLGLDALLAISLPTVSLATWVESLAAYSLVNQ
jgi:hypothetical protein